MGVYVPHDLGTTGPEIDAAIFGKAQIGISVKILLKNVSAVCRFSLNYTAELRMDVSITDPQRCVSITPKLSLVFEMEEGLCFTGGKWEVQAFSLIKNTKPIFEISGDPFYLSLEQGVHMGSQCAYSPADYCIRYVTNTGWQLPSECYLAKGTYRYSRIEAEVWSITETETAWRSPKVEGDPFWECKTITPVFVDTPDGVEEVLSNIIDLPKRVNNKKGCKWYMLEPTPVGIGEWKEDETVKQNLERNLGKQITKKADLPVTITLYPQWEDMLTVTFDANGGSFPSTSDAWDNKIVLYCEPDGLPEII